MSTRRSLFVRICFALLLAFAQQQAIVHALGHDFDRMHESSRSPATHDDAFCAKCLAVAQLDHAASGASTVPSLPAFAVSSPAAALPAGVSPAFLSAYLSRAPPLLT